MMTNKDYERFGRATLIPGMQYMIDIMQRELDYMRGSVNSEDSETVRDVIKKNSKKGSSQKDYWAKMTPEQRKKEMQRRMKVAAKKKEQPNG